VREAIRDGFCELIKDKYKNIEGIAGVATGAIAHGMLVADKLQLPFIYVRSSAKGHGLGNLIEGEFKPGANYVVIEDLISTGGSSLNAVDALREAGCGVLGMAAIFTYGFPHAVNNFSKNNCKLDTLSNYEILLEHALESNYIKTEDLEILREWRKAPDTWMQNK
jgi:orotate phosphoribosyltransferase